jgi:hypothetical protein
MEQFQVNADGASLCEPLAWAATNQFTPPTSGEAQ